MAQFSTHVLDTCRGRPASNVRIELYALNENALTLLHDVMTNDDGRWSSPLPLDRGVYQIVFSVAAYFRRIGITVPDPPFLDQVVIRFGIAHADERYHVPLLLSLHGYSTYRGS